MSEILENWREGKGLPGVLVIDGHIHVHDWPHGASFSSVEEMAVGCVEFMDANGVDACCVLSGGYMSSGTDYTVGNDVLLELVGRAPERLIGFASVNPNDSARGILAELARVHKAGLRCIKLLNSYQQGYPGDGPNLMEVYRFAADHSMLIINHSWTSNEILAISEKFPTVDFIFAHYGRGQDAVLKERANVWANIWSLLPLGDFEAGVRNVGPGKFMLGSDGVMNALSVGIGMVVYARIPDEHKRLILGMNLARLLEKVGALPPGLQGKLAGR